MLSFKTCLLKLQDSRRHTFYHDSEKYIFEGTLESWNHSVVACLCRSEIIVGTAIIKAESTTQWRQ